MYKLFVFVRVIHRFSGGPWVLPPSRPVCLRPMLLRKEYRAFAEDINRSMAWSPWAADMLFFYAMTLVAPPLSAAVMVRPLLSLLAQTSC